MGWKAVFHLSQYVHLSVCIAEGQFWVDPPTPHVAFRCIEEVLR